MEETIAQVLMRRDGMDKSEAEAMVEQAKEELHQMLEDGELVDDSDFMADWFGLEPDYIFELI
jgi:hypothetical protein